MIPLLHDELQYHPRTITKNGLIYSVNRKAEGFYYLHSGLVGLYRNTESGKEHLIRVYGKGDYFGYRSLFSNKVYHLTTRSLMSSQIHHIKVDSLDMLGQLSARTLNHLVCEVCTELGEAESRLSNVAAYSAKVRILDAMIHLFARFDFYSWTSREIAEYSGTDTQTVIRFSRILKNQHLLDPNSRKVKPIDLEALKTYRTELVSV